jgi:hypothetical protein
MPAQVPPCPVTLVVFDEGEEEITVVEPMVLRLLAIREMDGPSSAKGFVFDIVQ